METSIALLIFLIILSGAFSGAEIALTSLSRAKVRSIKEDGRFASSAIYRLKRKPHNTLITILIGNNVVNILATAIATLWASKVFGSHAIGIVTGGLTLLILVFGEITPKTFAQKYAVFFSRLIAYPLLGLSMLLFPIVWLLEIFIKGLMKILGAHHPITSVSEEELRAMVNIGAEEGVLERHEHEFIENVLEFTETTVEEVMTVRKDLDALDVSTSVHDAVHFFINCSHSRIPIFKNDLDHIVGVLTVHDVVKLLHNPEEVKTLRDLKYKTPIVVPKTKPIKTLFREFQRRRKHIAIVVDEHALTVGLVTMEDILEEIVGDIVDEQDKEDTGIQRLDNNTIEANGETAIEDINDSLGINLEYPEHHTVALLVLEQLGEFPKLGEKLEFENIQIQVTEMSKNKIEKVRISRFEPTPDVSTES